MDFLFDITEFLGSWIAAVIEQVTGWRPNERAKSVIDWFGVLASAFLGLWGIVALIRGGGRATKRDIEKLREELRGALASREAAAAPAGAPWASTEAIAHARFARDLNAAIDTLLKAGKASALKDKTGAAAEAAIDALIAERAAARERVGKDEAALWRQKGALAYLHNTAAALSAYAKATELDPDNAEGWNELGHLQFRVGDLDAAVKSYEQALALGNRSADQNIVAVATGNLGLVHLTRGNLDQAEAMLKKALAINEALGRKEGVANDYSNLGLIYRTRGNLDQAEAMHKKALTINESLERKEGVAADYGNLGLVYARRNDFDQAEKMHKKALSMHKELGDKVGMANDYGNLGNIYCARRDLDQAEEMHREALALNKSLDRKEGMANDYGNLGGVYQTRGDLDLAEAMHKQALAIDEALIRKESMAIDYSNLGGVYRLRGDVAMAQRHWRRARELFLQIGAQTRANTITDWLRDTGDRLV